MGSGPATQHNPKHKKFLELMAETHNVPESYIAAGFHAKNKDIARQNGCRLLRQLDKKLNYREIFDNIGLTDRYVATKIKDVVDDKDKHVSVKGLGLVARCKQWTTPNVNVAVGMQIVITNQSATQSQDSQDDTIDVTEISQSPPDDEMIQD